jgi:hypothetical protein
VFIYNAVEWYNIRQFLQSQTIPFTNLQPAQTANNSTATFAFPSSGTADALFWLSIILAVFGILVFLWSIINLFRGLYTPIPVAVTTEVKPHPQYIMVKPAPVPSAAPVTGAARRVESSTTTTFVPQGIAAPTYAPTSYTVPTTANLVTPGTASEVAFIAG